jgi:hypothetical protein
LRLPPRGAQPPPALTPAAFHARRRPVRARRDSGAPRNYCHLLPVNNRRSAACCCGRQRKRSRRRTGVCGQASPRLRSWRRRSARRSWAGACFSGRFSFPWQPGSRRRASGASGAP